MVRCGVLSDLSRERTNPEGVCLGLAWFAAGNAILFTSIWLPASLLIPIGAAALLHRYVELPAQKRGRRLAHRGTSYAVNMSVCVPLSTGMMVNICRL